MEAKKAIKTMFQASGVKLQDVAKNIGIAQPTFTIWLTKLNQIERLSKICTFCGCRLVITNDKDINITITEK